MNLEALLTKARIRLAVTLLAVAVCLTIGIFIPQYGIPTTIGTFGALLLMYTFADMDVITNSANSSDNPGGGTSVQLSKGA